MLKRKYLKHYTLIWGSLMPNENIKEKLKGFKYLEERCRDIKYKIDEIEQKVYYVNSTSVIGFQKNDGGEKEYLNNKVARLLDIKEQYASELLACEEERIEIKGIIELLGANTDKCRLLDKYYLQLKSLLDISDELCLSYSRTAHLHLEALDDLENLLNTKNMNK